MVVIGPSRFQVSTVGPDACGTTSTRVPASDSAIATTSCTEPTSNFTHSGENPCASRCRSCRSPVPEVESLGQVVARRCGMTRMTGLPVIGLFALE